MILETILMLVFAAAVAALPLYLALHIVGARKAGFIRVMLVNIVVALVIILIHSSFGTWAGLVAFIALLFIYKEMFGLGWIGAFLAWVLEAIVAVAIVILLVLLLGIALIL
jgi:hypothetical protein